MTADYAPHDSHTERWLIGACTYLPANLAVAIELGFQPGHMYHAAHRRQICELYDHWHTGTDPDPGLARDGTTGPAYDAPQISNPSAYVRVLMDLAARRAAIDTALGRRRPFLTWDQWADRPT